MTVEQLLKQLDKNEAILPKDLLSGSSVLELVDLIGDIYENKSLRNRIVSSKYLYENYLNLVNYLLIVHLNEKDHTKKPIFSTDLINNLLTLPEPA